MLVAFAHFASIFLVEMIIQIDADRVECRDALFQLLIMREIQTTEISGVMVVVKSQRVIGGTWLRRSRSFNICHAVDFRHRIVWHTNGDVNADVVSLFVQSPY